MDARSRIGYLCHAILNEVAKVGLEHCQVEGCSQAVSKAGYTFCLDHWKAERNGKVRRCPKCDRWHDADAPVRSVWIVEPGVGVPRLVTAYPAPERKSV